MPSRQSFICFFMLAASTGLATVAFAHDGGSPPGTAIMAVRQADGADGWIAASATAVMWLCAAYMSVRTNIAIAIGLALSSAFLAAALAVIWKVDSTIAAGLFLSTWFYGSGVCRLWRNTDSGVGIRHAQAACYFSGLAVVIVALLSPVDAVANDLFSMHMVQHELLMLVAAPLLVSGRSLAAFIWAFTPPWRKRIGRLTRMSFVRQPWGALTQPSFAWIQHALVLWAWHMPGLFQASLESDAVHTAQHVSFLLSALLFWSSLIGVSSRLQAGAAVLYVLTTAIHTGVLGALLTFSKRAWYPVYAGRTQAWGLSLLEDQQLGGLIMWVPAGFVFVLAGLAFAGRAIRPSVARPQA